MYSQENEDGEMRKYMDVLLKMYEKLKQLEIEALFAKKGVIESAYELVIALQGETEQTQDGLSLVEAKDLEDKLQILKDLKSLSTPMSGRKRRFSN